MTGSNTTIKIPSRFFIALADFAFANLLVWKISPFGIFTSQKTLADLVGETNQQTTSNMAKTWPWWVAKYFLEQDKAPDVVVLGDSQMATAIFATDAKLSGKSTDVVSHRHVDTLSTILSKQSQTNVSVFNAALAGSMASDYNLMARALFLNEENRHLQPRLVIIGISPRVFIDNTLPSASSTDSFRFFSQCVNPGSLLQFAFADYLGQLEWFINNRLPLSKVKKEIQAHLPANDTQKQTTSANNDFMKGMFASATRVESNEWFVPANMPYLFKDNTPEYIQRYRQANPPLYAGQQAFFSDLLGRLNQAHVEVLVIGMPSLPPNRSLLPKDFWTAYRANIATMCQANNADFLDLSANESYAIDDYLDTVHLNSAGGKKLLTTVAEHVLKTPRLASVLSTNTLATKNNSVPH